MNLKNLTDTSAGVSAASSVLPITEKSLPSVINYSSKIGFEILCWMDNPVRALATFVRNGTLVLTEFDGTLEKYQFEFDIQKIGKLLSLTDARALFYLLELSSSIGTLMDTQTLVECFIYLLKNRITPKSIFHTLDNMTDEKILLLLDMMRENSPLEGRISFTSFDDEDTF